MPLSDTACRNAKAQDKPFKLADSGGLYLMVAPSGARLWRWKYRIAGKENVYAIGEYPAVSLADARKARDDARALVKHGIHPAHDRAAQRAAQAAENTNTFEGVAREWIGKKKAGGTPYYLSQVERTMKADVYPLIGSLPVRSVSAAALLKIIRRVEGRGAISVALLIRQWCSAIFRYAVATLRADNDPAAALRGAIERPPVEHNRPLTKAEAKQFLTALDGFSGYRNTVIALRLMLTTFVRTVELRKASWSEFDLDAAVWRIPAERMKMRRPHVVPLSRQAVELFRELHTLTGGRELILPNNRRPTEAMTATTLNRALERLGFAGKGGIGFSAHGFRATASTMLNEMGFRADLIERQLAHQERDSVRASYNHAEYLPERTAMMQTWADYLDSLAAGGGNVVPIKAAA